MRINHRKSSDLRPVTITPNYLLYPEGSALITIGNTQVVCTVTIEKDIPRWKKNQGIPGGWITAEYAMLPRATHQRTPREINSLGGRTQEIRRLIGRSLRAAVDLEKLGQRTCTIDCDVLQADGGTRTAAITGGYVALVIALRKLIQDNIIPSETIKTAVAAVSAGVLDGLPVLDMCYEEDSIAQVDINVVMNSSGEFIEVQGTSESAPFTRSTLDNLLNLAYKGIGELLSIQRGVLDITHDVMA